MSYVVLDEVTSMWGEGDSQAEAEADLSRSLNELRATLEEPERVLAPELEAIRDVLRSRDGQP